MARTDFNILATVIFILVLHRIIIAQTANENNRQNVFVSYFSGIGNDVYQDGLNSICDIPGSFKNMFTIPFQDGNRTSTQIGLGILGISFFADKEMDNFLRTQWEPYCDRYIPKTEFPLPFFRFGFEKVNFHYDFVFLTVAEYGYMAGLLTRYERFRTLCFNLLRATAYSFIFAQPVKALTGRARPWRPNNSEQHHDPWEWGRSNLHFKNGGEYNSFPSFHAIFYYSYWTILMDFVGLRQAGPLAASLFYFQDPHHWHWASDMIAGGILGYWLASGILENSKNRKLNVNQNLSVSVIPIKGGLGLYVSKEF